MLWHERIASCVHISSIIQSSCLHVFTQYYMNNYLRLLDSDSDNQGKEVLGLEKLPPSPPWNWLLLNLDGLASFVCLHDGLDVNEHLDSFHSFIRPAKLNGKLSGQPLQRTHRRLCTRQWWSWGTSEAVQWTARVATSRRTANYQTAN